jgi:hypothetical protein
MRRARLKDVLGWLSYATTPAFIGSQNGIPRSRGPALASGALQAITPVLLSGAGQPRVWRCEAQLGIVGQLAVADAASTLSLRAQARELLPDCRGCDLVVLVSDDALLESVYDEWETLAWRDAGAMLQTLGFAATALGLGFCPLGILGSMLLEGLAAPRRFRARGVAVVGV